MKLIIDIDDETYNDIKKGKIYSSFRDVPLESVNAIANGIPLPKGHGRLIDADELTKQLETVANDEWNKQVGASKGLEDAVDIVDDAPTIIEADKAESEEKMSYSERTIENVVEIIRVMPYQFTMGEAEKFSALLNERLDEILEIHKEERNEIHNR